MLTRQPDEFVAYARTLAPDFGPATPRAVFLVSPDGFARAEQSASDNAYMQQASSFDAVAALQAHRRLHVALSAHVPTICFAGQPDTPDALFPNNVFATATGGVAAGRLVVGRMLHAVRQKEAERADIREFFTGVLGLGLHDLSAQSHPCELTGAMVIDRARGLGWCGLSERCTEEGARLLHEAFGLRATLCFDLAAGEYHTNVVLAVLAGRAAIVCPAGFADQRVVTAVQSLYGPQVVQCTPAEHAAFVGNAIGLTPHTLWMSERAAKALRPSEKERLAAAGFTLHSVELSAIEVAGGSLRCCIGEVY